MGFSVPREPDSPTPNRSLSKFLSSDWPLTGCSYLFTLLGTLGLCPRLCLKRPPDFPLSVPHFFFMSRDIWGLQVAPGAAVSQSLLISTWTPQCSISQARHSEPSPPVGPFLLMRAGRRALTKHCLRIIFRFVPTSNQGWQDHSVHFSSN